MEFKLLENKELKECENKYDLENDNLQFILREFLVMQGDRL